MSKITESSKAYANAKSNADYDEVLNKILWDAFYLQSMLADFFNISNENDVKLTLSDNGLRGLAMLMDHCADLTIDAIGIIPGGPLKMKEANHE